MSIALERRADNTEALSVYCRRGFTQTQRVPGDNDGRIAARRMTLRRKPAAS